MALIFRGSSVRFAGAHGGLSGELRGLTRGALNRPMGRGFRSPARAVLGNAACGFDLATAGLLRSPWPPRATRRRVFRWMASAGLRLCAPDVERRFARRAALKCRTPCDRLWRNQSNTTAVSVNGQRGGFELVESDTPVLSQPGTTASTDVAVGFATNAQATPAVSKINNLPVSLQRSFSRFCERGLD